MLKKFLFSFAMLVLFSGAAFASNVEIYRNPDYDMEKITSVLVLPVEFQVIPPEKEAFFKEEVNERWSKVVPLISDKYSFVVKKPKEIVEREAFVKGTAVPDLSPKETVEKACSVSDQYVKGNLKAKITDCGYKKLHHPETVEWVDTYDYIEEKRDGKWVKIRVPRRYQKVTPAWDEWIASATVLVELRDPKTDDLILGVTASADTGRDLFTAVPSLTAQASNVLEKAVKKLVK